MNPNNDLIKANSSLFWWVPEEKKQFLPVESLVEAILNYGTADSVRQLFNVCGIENVAGIFHKQTSGMRSNYHPQTINYFTLYFRKHAQRSS